MAAVGSAAPASLGLPFQAMLEQGVPGRGENPGGLKPSKDTRKAGKALQVGMRKDPGPWAAPQPVKQEPGETMPHGWEGSLQEFLKAAQSPHPGWGNPQLLMPTPWEENGKAFLGPFETPADTWLWPRGEWGPRPFAGDVQPPSYASEARDRAEGGKLKAEALMSDPVGVEVQRRRFRQFCYLEAEGPREVCLHLRALCRLWLEPERHTKEQILERVILEQFLTILPTEIQSCVREQGAETCAQAVALAEEFLKMKQEPKSWEQQQVLKTFRETPKAEQGPPDNRRWQLYRETKLDSDGDVSSLAGEGWVSENEEEKSQRTCAEKTDPSGRSGFLYQEQLETFEGELKAENLHEGPFREGECKPVPCQRLGHKLGETAVRERLHGDRCKKVCMECGKSFGRSSDLLKHRRTHTGEKPFQCLHCGRSFSDRSNLIAHRRIHADKKPYQCLDCGKSFCQNSYLVRHRRTHTGEKPYKCSYCGKGFSDSSNLVVHKRTHTASDKPYRCLDCGRKFGDPSLLSRHQRMHAKERPYDCSDCGKTFRHRSDLVRHRRTHTGEKPFKCLDCGKGFSQRSHCSTHERRHSRQKLYSQCSDNGKAFGLADLELPPKDEVADTSPRIVTQKDMKMGHMCVLLHTEWGYL